MPLVDYGTIGRRIADARGRAGLTQEELARAIGLDRSALAKIETGIRRVTALELARIVDQTGERFEWFVREPSAAVHSYRSGTGSTTTSSIDRMLEQIARDVALVQSLQGIDVAPIEPYPQPKTPAEAAHLAQEARRLLRLPQPGPIIDLVTPLADLGLFAFSADLGADAPDAATTLLHPGGVSVINSDRAVGRRRLALAHALGHYLLADEYTIDWRVGVELHDQDREYLLDVFARALLLPAESLIQRWKKLTDTESLRTAAVRIASEYRIDMSILAARLADLNLAEEDELDRIRTFRTTRADIIEHDLVVTHDLAGTTLPRRYEKAVLALYRAERISPERAINLLQGTIGESGLPDLPPAHENEIWKFIS